MKIRILFAALAGFMFISYSSLAQDDPSSLPIDKDTQMITYQEVVQQAGTADELYIRCIEWINTEYKNPADVCRVRNRESAVIEIRHRIEYFNDAKTAKVVAGKINYVLKLEFKPGRYRYTVTEMTLHHASRVPIEKWLDKEDTEYSPLWDSYLMQINTQVSELIARLKAGMEPPIIKVEEKW